MESDICNVFNGPWTLWFLPPFNDVGDEPPPVRTPEDLYQKARVAAGALGFVVRLMCTEHKGRYNIKIIQTEGMYNGVGWAKYAPTDDPGYTNTAHKLVERITGIEKQKNRQEALVEGVKGKAADIVVFKSRQGQGRFFNRKAAIQYQSRNTKTEVLYKTRLGNYIIEKRLPTGLRTKVSEFEDITQAEGKLWLLNNGYMDVRDLEQSIADLEL